jgi:hypothetical protein
VAARAATLESWIAAARDWVLAVERAYVAAAVGGGGSAAGAPGPAPPGAGGDPLLHLVAAAAAGAVAARYLAVGRPRSIGLIGDPVAAALCLAAHRVWLDPRDLRCALGAGGGAQVGGRDVAIAEALAADVVCIAGRIASGLGPDAPLAAVQLRRGTHVSVLAPEPPVPLDAELRALATIADEGAGGLPALAAGLIDGRQLDELTVFIAGDLAIPRGALAAR